MEILERAGDPTGFRMQIKHGRFQVVMTEHDLDIPDKGPILERMRCKTMAKIMRCKAMQIAADRRRSHRTLDIAFVTTPPHHFVGSWVATERMGREQPGPAFNKGGVGIFLG